MNFKLCIFVFLLVYTIPVKTMAENPIISFELATIGKTEAFFRYSSDLNTSFFITVNYANNTIKSETDYTNPYRQSSFTLESKFITNIIQPWINRFNTDKIVNNNLEFLTYKADETELILNDKIINVEASECNDLDRATKTLFYVVRPYSYIKLLQENIQLLQEDVDQKEELIEALNKQLDTYQNNQKPSRIATFFNNKGYVGCGILTVIMLALLIYRYFPYSIAR